MLTTQLEIAEAEIDAYFASSVIADLPYAQAVWVLLSVAEDYNYKANVHAPLSKERLAMFVDTFMNELTHPLRVCHQRSARLACPIDRRLDNDLYQKALDWFKLAKSYNQFCSIFPMHRNKLINLEVDGEYINSSNWRSNEISYEVYDRFLEKRAPQDAQEYDYTLVIKALLPKVQISHDSFTIKFDKNLLLRDTIGRHMRTRHILPSGWRFSRFTLQEYRDVFTCLQALAHSWYFARQYAINSGAQRLCFGSSVWVLKKSALNMLLHRTTGNSLDCIGEILGYLTFGNAGVRHPDVAIQPIFDLQNGQYAISPFLVMNTNGERNLCVLLNQVPEEKRIYSKLVEEKEAEARNWIIKQLAGMGFDFRYGEIVGTDIDLSIIDRQSKVCLCIEIKWFIEPAEVRELIVRSEEIKKGIDQALKIQAAFNAQETSLCCLLDIDDSFDFLSMVASENSIGMSSAQSPAIPVVKLWHLVSEIRKHENDLGLVMKWLRSRAYLPQEGNDYRVVESNIQCGKWSSRWYGIDYLHQEPEWLVPK